MAILTIRPHKRYAVRHSVCLQASGGREVKGLLIELSARGCRISNLDCAKLSDGDQVILALQDALLSGRVKWTREGVAGFSFEDPLLLNQLGDLVTGDRGHEEVVS